MEEIYQAVKRRFESNARLVQLGRAIYPAGNIKTEEPPYVSCLVVTEEDVSTFDADVFKGTAEFAIVARGPASDRCAAIAEELFRTFHDSNWESSFVHVNVMRMRSATTVSREPESETNLLTATMRFAWTA